MSRLTDHLTSLTWSVITTCLVALPSLPAMAQEDHSRDSRALYVQDIETLESKFLDLAEAMSSEQYSWRPMEGVRS